MLKDMKKIGLLIVSILFVLAIAVACDGGENEEGDNPSQVTITCDKQDGFSRNGDEVTFTAAGTYVFTVTATN